MVLEAKVTFWDSKTLSCPQGWQVEAAARALQAGWKLDRITDEIQPKIAEAPVESQFLKVEAGKVREFGYAEVRARGHTKLFDGIEDFRTDEGHGMLKVWMSHGDKVTELPPGFKLMASTPSCPIAGMADEARRFYAVQFHPEVTHTLPGLRTPRAGLNVSTGPASVWP